MSETGSGWRSASPDSQLPHKRRPNVKTQRVGDRDTLRNEGVRWNGTSSIHRFRSTSWPVLPSDAGEEEVLIAIQDRLQAKRYSALNRNSQCPRSKRPLRAGFVPVDFVLQVGG